jgi:Conserved hypothetical protein 2217 (DUF2460)
MSEPVYPQLTQFPVVKRRRMRTVVNRSADGRTVRLADLPGETTEWQLQYAELSDDEAATLRNFFAAAEGTLNGFTFLDPTANLLAWSGKLDEAVWLKGPLLTVSGGPTEWHLSNTGGGAQSITQTIAGPAGYVYCVSAEVRGTAGTVLTMLAGSLRAARTLAADWKRIAFSGTADAATFGLELAAGAAVDVRGIQLEAQAGASTYRESTTGGVYEGARFRDDALEIVATGVNRHSCTVNVIYANHL